MTATRTPARWLGPTQWLKEALDAGFEVTTEDLRHEFPRSKYTVSSVLNAIIRNEEKAGRSYPMEKRNAGTRAIRYRKAGALGREWPRTPRETKAKPEPPAPVVAEPEPPAFPALLPTPRLGEHIQVRGLMLDDNDQPVLYLRDGTHAYTARIEGVTEAAP